VAAGDSVEISGESMKPMRCEFCGSTIPDPDDVGQYEGKTICPECRGKKGIKLPWDGPGEVPLGVLEPHEAMKPTAKKPAKPVDPVPVVKTLTTTMKEPK